LIKDLEAKIIKDRILEAELKEAHGYNLTLDTKLHQVR
jgi:hypothetical protein